MSANEKLQCPANSKRSDVDIGVGYETFAKRIGFQQLSSTSDLILVPETLLKLASDSSLRDFFFLNIKQNIFQVAPYLIFLTKSNSIIGENFMLVAKNPQFTPKYSPNCLTIRVSVILSNMCILHMLFDFIIIMCVLYTSDLKTV